MREGQGPGVIGDVVRNKMKSNSLSRLVGQSARGSLIVSAVLMATSACVYAQTSVEPGTHQLTRAEVRNELKELEAVGYRPIPNDLYYPDDIQAAEQRLEAKHQAEKNALTGGSQIAQRKSGIKRMIRQSTH